MYGTVCVSIRETAATVSGTAGRAMAAREEAVGFSSANGGLG